MFSKELQLHSSEWSRDHENEVWKVAAFGVGEWVWSSVRHSKVVGGTSTMAL